MRLVFLNAQYRTAIVKLADAIDATIWPFADRFGDHYACIIV
jgi:hypothetical protein